MIYIAAISSIETDLAKNQLQKSQETWAKTIISYDELFFIHGKSTNIEFIDSVIDFKYTKHTQINNEIFYDVVDRYDLSDASKFNATYKTLLSIRDFLKTNHSYYVRTHTGSYFNLPLLSDYCKMNLSPVNTYAGVLGTAFVSPDTIHFCSGACFIISRDIASLIWDNHEEILNLYIHRKHKYNCVDDVFLGNIINTKFKIPRTPLPRIECRTIPVSEPFHFHYLFVDKYKSIEQNWYNKLHMQFGF